MAKTWSMFWLIPLALAGAGACGGGSSTNDVVSCTMATTNVFGPTVTCEEAPASYRSDLQKACVLPADAGLGTAGIGAHFTDGPCSHVNALGGCKTTIMGIAVTIWYYQSNGVGGATSTSADIQTTCNSSGGTFVAP